MDPDPGIRAEPRLSLHLRDRDRLLVGRLGELAELQLGLLDLAFVVFPLVHQMNGVLQPQHFSDPAPVHRVSPRRRRAASSSLRLFHASMASALFWRDRRNNSFDASSLA